jgi:hypothetical protein
LRDKPAAQDVFYYLRVESGQVMHYEPRRVFCYAEIVPQHQHAQQSVGVHDLVHNLWPHVSDQHAAGEQVASYMVTVE